MTKATEKFGNNLIISVATTIAAYGTLKVLSKIMEKIEMKKKLEKINEENETKIEEEA